MLAEESVQEEASRLRADNARLKQASRTTESLNSRATASWSGDRNTGLASPNPADNPRVYRQPSRRQTRNRFNHVTYLARPTGFDPNLPRHKRYGTQAGSSQVALLPCLTHGSFGQVADGVPALGATGPGCLGPGFDKRQSPVELVRQRRAVQPHAEIWDLEVPGRWSIIL